MRTLKQVSQSARFAAMHPTAVAARNANCQATNAPTFALAGELVNTAPQARRILIDAIRTDKQWLVPQAESVLRKIRASQVAA